MLLESLISNPARTSWRGRRPVQLGAFHAQLVRLPVLAGRACRLGGGVQAAADQHRIAGAACRGQRCRSQLRVGCGFLRPGVPGCGSRELRGGNGVICGRDARCFGEQIAQPAGRNLVLERAGDAMRDRDGLRQGRGPGPIVARGLGPAGRGQQQVEGEFAAPLGRRHPGLRQQVRGSLAGAGRQAGGPLKMPARLGEVPVRVGQMPEAAGQAVTHAVWSRPGAGAERGPQVVGDRIEAGPPSGLN